MHTLSAASALDTFVNRLRALSPLSDADVAAIKGLTTQVTRVPANTDIIVPGQSFESAVLVASGLVGRFLQLADGRRQITAIHLPGDIVDLHRVAAPRAGSALQALSNVAFVRVSGRELRAIALASPAITQAFWVYSAIDAAILARWATNLRRDAKGRLAHLLCEIGTRMENSRQSERGEFMLDLTQSQIGDALGLTPVHVNRTLKALKALGVLETEGRIVRVPDWPRLAAIADFDPDYLQVEPPAEAAA
jgi:CRP-like cAMP-binding protein